MDFQKQMSFLTNGQQGTQSSGGSGRFENLLNILTLLNLFTGEIDQKTDHRSKNYDKQDLVFIPQQSFFIL